jgi:hypothetical protein
MDANPFLDYLHDHAATAGLAEALTDIVDMRRALAMRRSRAARRLIPIEVGAGARQRAAS